MRNMNTKCHYVLFSCFIFSTGRIANINIYLSDQEVDFATKQTNDNITAILKPTFLIAETNKTILKYINNGVLVVHCTTDHCLSDSRAEQSERSED